MTTAVTPRVQFAPALGVLSEVFEEPGPARVEGLAAEGAGRPIERVCDVLPLSSRSDISTRSR
ncbi:hypothetical protein [Halospeciosus flavus]|uniref:hypothetical protein n=1 Tax=Halospeciosus flavus TaxID=3032283 RepID=UPI003608C89B